MSTTELPPLAQPRSDGTALAPRLLAALRTTMFGSRLLVTPRRLGQIAEEAAGSYQRYLAGEECDDTVEDFGQRLAQDGLGHRSTLALVGALHESAGALAPCEPSVARAAARYSTHLLAGYMEAREAYLLKEQERTRLALERARAQHDEGG